jgi:Mn2+/Fe2+ NRAMP family transporter
MPLTTSYTVCESFGWESGVSRKFHEAPVFMGLYTALIAVGAVVVLVPGLPLVGVILVSQNLNGILLPIILVFMLKLVNNPRIMGRHVNPTWLNLVAWTLTALVTLLTAILFGTTITGWFGLAPGSGSPTP